MILLIRHSHEHGLDTKLVRVKGLESTSQLPDDSVVSEAFDIDYEPEKGEDIEFIAFDDVDIEEVSLDVLLGEDPSTKLREACKLLEGYGASIEYPGFIQITGQDLSMNIGNASGDFGYDFKTLDGAQDVEPHDALEELTKDAAPTFLADHVREGYALAKPLDLSLSHEVAYGVFSAKRNDSGKIQLSRTPLSGGDSEIVETIEAEDAQLKLDRINLAIGTAFVIRGEGKVVSLI